MHSFDSDLRTAEVDDLINAYLELRLPEHTTIYFQRVGDVFGWEWPENNDGSLHLAHLIGMWIRDDFEPPEGFTAPDAWVYLPAPVDWPSFATVDELRDWITTELNAAGV